MTRCFGLVGKTLVHSWSKLYYDRFFSENDLDDCCYGLYELPDIGRLPQLLAENPGIEGLNVTIPYKRAVVPYLYRSDAVAEAVGAVNCIKVERLPGNDIRLYGYNTDAEGFGGTLFDKPSAAKQYGKALILGTGGVAAAVAFVLQRYGIRYSFVSRNPTAKTAVGNIAGGCTADGPRAAGRIESACGKIVRGSRPQADVLSYVELTEDIVRTCRLIVNCTPVGMYPQAGGLPALPYDGITPQHYLYDVVYNPPVTRFMEEGLRRGAFTRNGLAMLHAQAAASLRIFRLTS